MQRHELKEVGSYSGEDLISISKEESITLQEKGINPVNESFGTTVENNTSSIHKELNDQLSEMEDMISDDATWKKIQQNTFTRWANEHLKTIHSHIINLETDLEDGLKLIGLLQVLSGKILPKHNKKPNFRSQKLENVSVALNFLEKDEGVKLVNIDSSDIVDCKLKLILGLIWHLILHYSISKPVWEGDEEKDPSTKGPTPKQRLLNWIQNRVPGVTINNFTSDWKDGRALGALVDSCAPGLCPDWDNWNPNEGLENVKEAMGLGDDWLDVRQLIQPEELVNPNLDELSMMTYLSQYPSAKLKEGAPLRPRTDPSRVRCYGPGIQPSGCTINTPAPFTIDTSSAGKGSVHVKVLYPDGSVNEMHFDEDQENIFNPCYTPTEPGTYIVEVFYGYSGHMFHVPRSPFHVLVDEPSGDPSKIVVFGEGVSPDGLICKKQTYFDISTKDAGKGIPEVVILDPSGDSKAVKVNLRPINDHLWRAEYCTSNVGLHSVNVFYNRQHVTNSPFPVSIAPICDPSKVRTSGRGLRPKGVRVGDTTATFEVHTESAGEGDVEAKLIEPSGKTSTILLRKLDGKTYEGNYIPKSSGKHLVYISYGRENIPNSPFNVTVGQKRVTGARAYGPGLSKGVVSYPAKFVVETNGEAGAALGFLVEGPSQADIQCTDYGDFSCAVSYTPSKAGDYYVRITDRDTDEDIENSPFHVKVQPESDEIHPEQVQCFGKGVECQTLSPLEPTQFTIDSRNAGSVPIAVQVMDSSDSINVKLEGNADGTQKCEYTPLRPGKHTIIVSQGGVATTESPYRANAVGPFNPSKMKVSGPGVEKYVPSLRPTYFNIDTKDCGGNGESLKVEIRDANGTETPYKVHDNGDDTFTIEYVPTLPGKMKILIAEDFPPILIDVHPHLDLSKIKICGLPKVITIGRRQVFSLEYLGFTDTVKFHIPVRLATPSRKELKIDEVADDRFTFTKGTSALLSFTPFELGEYTLLYGECYEFRVLCVPPAEAGRVRVYGNGIQKGIVSTLSSFIIDTREAGSAALCVTISGPEELQINCLDNYDGTCLCSFLPKTPGYYKIEITFDGRQVPGSPYLCKVVSKMSSMKNRLSHETFVDSITEFDVEGIPANQPLSCIVTSDSGTKYEGRVTPKDQETAKVSFTPTKEGLHQIELICDGLPVPETPLAVKVKHGSDATRVKAYGKGLERAVVNEPNIFHIETKACGTGGLGLQIEGPTEALITCKDNRDGSCTVEYVPTSVGNYDIVVTFDDKNIPGSPFKLNAVHSKPHHNVTAYGDGINPMKVREGVSQTFYIDAGENGPAEMSCEISGLHKHPVVKELKDGKFEVTYLPPLGSAGKELTYRLKYDGKDIPKSPFHIKVKPKCEPNQMKLYGDGISHNGIPASVQTSFTIDGKEAGVGTPTVQVIGPDGRERKVTLKEIESGIYSASYCPEDCGLYKISVNYEGNLVSSVPVTAFSAGSSANCKVSNGKKDVIRTGEQECITVECKDEGPGSVTCRIKSVGENELLNVNVIREDDGKSYCALYKVEEPGNYEVELKYGGQPIDGGSYTFKAIPPGLTETYQYTEHTTYYETSQSYRKEDSESQTLFRTFEVERIPVPTGGNLSAEIKMPTGKLEKPILDVTGHEGFVTVKYEPKMAGVHELLLKHNGKDVPGSPYFFFVDSTTSDSLTAYGPGLTHGICGEPCHFQVLTKGSKAAGLQFSIEGSSKADIKCTDNKDGSVGVQYIATSPGEYKISVKSADKHIKGSPYTAKISGEGRKRNQISVGSFSEVAFPDKMAQETDIKKLNAFIHAPSGLEEPCILKTLANGKIGISFTPREAGQHEVSVRKSGNHIQGSPFKVEVSQKDVGDASKVVVTGLGLVEGKTHTENKFHIDTSRAGFGGISLSIEGPSKCEIKHQEASDNSLDISYIPTEPGYYTISLKYADHNVIQTVVKVTGEGSNRHREKIQHKREAVPIAEIGSECRLTFKMPGVTTFDLSASVTSPSGVKEDAAIAEVEDGYGVKFVPKELGIHTVSIWKSNVHIPGSPFAFTVGGLKDGGAHRVRCGGYGLERGEQGIPCEFNIWTREAGPGLLAISVEGPSRAVIDLIDRKDGSCYVKYEVSEPGEYRVGIRFDEEEIPGSPFMVYISPDSGDAKKVEVGQFPQGDVLMNKPGMLTVTKNGAKGQLDAKIVSPSGLQDDCFIDTVDFDSYSVRFLPKENGINHLHIKCNNVHVPGSPFPVKVGTDDADPACVRVYGKGIEQVESGQKAEFLIDVSHAGTGHLATTVTGPSKVVLDCIELEDEYKVHWTPLATGFYYVSVKLNGVHVPCSPFKVPCTGKEVADKGMNETSTVVIETTHKLSKSQGPAKPSMPTFKSDASKVTTKGMGLKKAYLGKQNQFILIIFKRINT